MAVRHKVFRSRRRRKARPEGPMQRVESLTTPRDRPVSAPEFGSGVLPPGLSRYQRNSAHLPATEEPAQRDVS